MRQLDGMTSVLGESDTRENSVSSGVGDVSLPGSVLFRNTVSKKRFPLCREEARTLSVSPSVNFGMS